MLSMVREACQRCGAIAMNSRATCSSLSRRLEGPVSVGTRCTATFALKSIVLLLAN